jgi:carbamoyl-phosphate synthase large subunit
MTIADKDKEGIVDVAKQFAELGFKILTTAGTKECLAAAGIDSELVSKMREKRPHIGDLVVDGNVQLLINTPRGKASKADDAYIRQAAIRCKVPYITTIAAAVAAVNGIAACRESKPEVKSLQAYHADLN